VNVALIAGLAMVGQDILGVCMVQAENRGHGWLTGVLDAGMFLFALVTYHYSLNTLNGHSTRERVLVLVLVTIANVVGSKSGQVIGDRFIKPKRDALWGLLITKGLVTEADWVATQHPKNRHIRRLKEAA
jgi:hypothetical protein